MNSGAPISTVEQAFAPPAYAVSSLPTYSMYWRENQLGQGAKMNYFGDVTKCVKTARDFRRGFGRNGDNSHKLQDVSGFLHTDNACLYKEEGKTASTFFKKGDSCAWVTRAPKHSLAKTASEFEPAPADSEAASTEKTLRGRLRRKVHQFFPEDGARGAKE